MVGTADGRILSYDEASGEATPIGGQGHTNLVAAMTTSENGKVYSAGYDDRLREVEGTKFTCVALVFMHDSCPVHQESDFSLLLFDLE